MMNLIRHLRPYNTGRSNCTGVRSVTLVSHLAGILQPLQDTVVFYDSMSGRPTIYLGYSRLTDNYLLATGSIARVAELFT